MPRRACAPVTFKGLDRVGPGLGFRVLGLGFDVSSGLGVKGHLGLRVLDIDIELFIPTAKGQ